MRLVGAIGPLAGGENDRPDGSFGEGGAQGGAARPGVHEGGAGQRHVALPAVSSAQQHLSHGVHRLPLELHDGVFQQHAQPRPVGRSVDAAGPDQIGRRKRTMRFMSFIMVGAVAASVVARADAQIIPDNHDRPAFGLVGLTRRQSALVNVSIDNPDTRTGDLPAGPSSRHDRVRGRSESAVRRSPRRRDHRRRHDQSRRLALARDPPERNLQRSRRGAKAAAARRSRRYHPESPDLPAGPCRGFAATLELLDSAAGATSVLSAPGEQCPTSESEDSQRRIRARRRRARAGRRAPCVRRQSGRPARRRGDRQPARRVR